MKHFFLKLLGYHSQHCPRCHRRFHRLHKIKHQVKIEGKHYRIVCPDCAKVVDIDSKKDPV